MVSNPFSEGLAVRVSGETSGATTALANLQGSLKNAKFAVAGLGTALAGLATGALAKATQQAQSFDDAITELSKRVGEDQAEEMRVGIEEMAETIPLTREELTGMADDAARFGVEGKENILEFTEVAAQMGVATRLSVDEASESLVKLSEITGTPIEQVDQLGSSINTLSNNMAASSDEIVEASLKSASALGRMGLEQHQIFGLNSALLEVSESSRRAGTRMRRLAQEALDPGKAEDLAAALNMDVEEFGNMQEEAPMDLLVTMVETFDEGGESADKLATTLSSASQQALGPLSNNLEGIKEGLDTANNSFEEGSSLQREFDIEMQKTSAQIDVMVSKLRGIAIEIGNNVLPIFRRFLDGIIVPAIERFSQLNDESGGMAGTLGLVGTAIAGVGAALAALVGGPVTLAIGAIAALSTAWALGWDEIQTQIQQGVEVAQNAIRTAATWIQENGPQLVGQAFEAVGSAIRFVLLDLKKAIVGDDSSIIGSLLVDIGKWIVNNGPGIVVGAVKTLIDLIIAAFQGLYDGLIGNSLIPELFNDIADWIINNGIDLVVGAIDGVIDNIQNLFGNVLDTLTGNNNQTQVGRGPGPNGASGRNIEVKVEGDTGVIKNVTAQEIDSRERTVNRQSGRSPSPGL